MKQTLNTETKPESCLASVMPCFSVWMGNGYWKNGGNKNVFTGTEKECEDFITQSAEKKRKRNIQLYFHIRTGILVKQKYFYMFLSENKAQRFATWLSAD